MASDIPPGAGASVFAERRLHTPVSWSAVFAGAAASTALGVLLTTLASGFGMNLAVAGLASRGSIAGFSSVVGAWAVIGQVLCGALGGYLAGRLRSHWGETHLDEVHFRDTAHGLISWAVSTVISVILAAVVLGPYADRVAGPSLAATAGAPVALNPDVVAQSSFFIGLGMLLSAFVACVAAALGGMRNEEMIARP